MTNPLHSIVSKAGLEGPVPSEAAIEQALAAHDFTWSEATGDRIFAQTVIETARRFDAFRVATTQADSESKDKA